MRKIAVLCLTDKIRPASELVDELASEAAAGNFQETALIVAESGGSDRVHFIWYDGDDAGACTRIERLVKQGWIPLALLGIDEDGRLLARPLREHEKGNGIKWFLRKVMRRAALRHNQGFDEPSSSTVH